MPNWSSAAVLVSGGIGAVKVGILAAHEAAVLVVCMQGSSGQFAPRVSHDLLNGPLRDRATRATDLLPVVKEGIVERTHVLGGTFGKG